MYMCDLIVQILAEASPPDPSQGTPSQAEAKKPRQCVPSRPSADQTQPIPSRDEPPSRSGLTLIRRVIN